MAGGEGHLQGNVDCAEKQWYPSHHAFKIMGIKKEPDASGSVYEQGSEAKTTSDSSKEASQLIDAFASM